MTDATHPNPPTTIDKRGSITTLDGVEQRFKVTDEIRHPASNMPEDRVFYLQQLAWDTGRTEYRFCYYIVGKTGNSIFGRYAPIIPAEDLRSFWKKRELGDGFEAGLAHVGTAT